MISVQPSFLTDMTIEKLSFFGASLLDGQFRKRLQRLFLAWQEGVATLLRKGQSQGTVRRDLNTDEAATFLVAMVEGYEVLAKNAQDTKVWEVGIRNIVGWLKSLRVPRQSWRGGRRMLKKHELKHGGGYSSGVNDIHPLSIRILCPGYVGPFHSTAISSERLSHAKSASEMTGHSRICEDFQNASLNRPCAL